MVIVMEYIRGSHCHAPDVTRVADALKSLLDMMRLFDQNQFSPSLIVKNAMKHPFFERGLARCTYQTANDLGIHANGVLEMEKKDQVAHGRFNFAEAL